MYYKKPVYAPMLSTFGGGSAQGFKPYGPSSSGTGSGIYYPDTSISSSTTITASVVKQAILTGTFIGGITNQDGTKYWHPQYSGSDVWIEYESGGTPWTLSSWASSTTRNGLLNYGSFNILERPCHVCWYDSGNKATISGVDEGYLWRLSLSTAYDLSTATVSEVVNFNWFSNRISGDGAGWFFVNDTFTKGVAKGYGIDNPIYRFDLNGSTLASASNFTQLIAGSDWNVFSIGGGDISPDGRMIVDLGYTSGFLTILDLGAGNDVFTAPTSAFSSGNIYQGPSIQIDSVRANGGNCRFDWYNQAGLDNGKIRFTATNTGTNRLGIGEIDHL